MIATNDGVLPKTAPEVESCKDLFRQGWNDPARVDNYVRHVAEGEFEIPELRAAWAAALHPAIRASAGRDVLDVGTGPGIFAHLYCSMGCRCTGLDFSQRMLTAAATRARERGLHCRFVEGDAENLPFDDESFDIVSSRHLLFNLPRPGLAIREWLRVLRPGGRLILMGEEHDPPGRSGWKASLRRSLGKLLLWMTRKGPRRPGWRPTPQYLRVVSSMPLFQHTPGAIRALMEAAGAAGIQSLDASAILAARRSHAGLARRWHLPPAAPYILIGNKPKTWFPG